MRKNNNVKISTFRDGVTVKLTSVVMCEEYHELERFVDSTEDLLFEINEIAVEYSGFTIDLWDRVNDNDYTFLGEDGEIYNLTINF